MSLTQRIILSATLVLTIFISLTAVTLERAFVDSSESALRDTLTSQLYALMAAAEVENDTVLMPSDELDVLLGLPKSGLYAYITDHNANILWQSSSVLGAMPPQPLSLTAGNKQFDKLDNENQSFYRFAYGVDWASDSSNIALTFNISTNLDSFERQISQYRQTLWSWLLAMAALLLFSQALLLRWGLSPLRRVGAELNHIEAGDQEQIEQHYPQEIEQLTSNINFLLQQERNQKTRYRNALGDLAHSLKTPLAVLQNNLSKNQQNETSLEQLTRMNNIVEYQLQRAATAGSSSIANAVNVATLTHRILNSLYKVYPDKAVRVEVHIDESITFRGDEGDLMELLGNLLDNAFKWARLNIEVRADKTGNKLTLSVGDDGPGISHHKAEELLQRGKRADQNTPGHGIGLSIVQNIVIAYEGELRISANPSGGTLISLTL